MDDINNDGWNEWKRHILIQLERISEFIESSVEERAINMQRISQVKDTAESKIQDLKNEISNDLNEIRRDIAKVNTLIGSKVDTIDMLKNWKKESDDTSIIETVKDFKEWKTAREEIASNKNLGEIVKKVEDNEKFKTKLVTIYLVIQVIVFILLGLIQSKNLW